MFPARPPLRPTFPGGRRGRNGQTLLLLALSALGVLMLALALMIAFGFLGVRRFVRFGIRSDLTEYQEAIIASNLSDAEQRFFNRRIDAIRDGLASGRPSFLAWIAHDEVIERILADLDVSPAEKQLLDGELTRVERELGVPVRAGAAAPPGL